MKKLILGAYYLRKHHHTKITGISKHYWLRTFNVTSLSFKTKRQILTYWIRKQNPSFHWLQKSHLTISHLTISTLELKGKVDKQAEQGNKQV